MIYPTLYLVSLLLLSAVRSDRTSHYLFYVQRINITWQFSYRNCIAQTTLSMGKLQLKVRGEKLPNMDLFSKSDPYLCVYIARDNEEDYHFINRTEVKKDDLNPQWEELLLDHEDINQHNLKAKIKLEVPDMFNVYDTDRAECFYVTS